MPYISSSIKSLRSVVHLEYEPDTLPPPPSDQWTRFVCISDTHTRTFPVPDGDVLLHSRDLTNTETVADFQKTMEWLFSLPHKVKIIIAGNHDLALHKEWYDGAGHVGKQTSRAAWSYFENSALGRVDPSWLVYSFQQSTLV
ncbi:hypothetical protein H0H81_012769 [Sphagnurus paluster]|uniref:Calcineurin-like phosphoesterase domain-containing protein n=1 Tax=Sphagnurus paluster TaxID=117069 RepID=A0A9P7KHX8_9AGAR|nr:hypothetical protein H0H81_012769 [Sphagnurus paluster]